VIDAIIGDGPHSLEIQEICGLYFGNVPQIVNKEQEENLDLKSILIMGLGNIDVRYLAFKKLIKLGYDFRTLIHPSSVISKSARILKGSVVMPGVVISSNTEIGQCTLVNWNSSIGHDVVIGDCCIVAPQVAISGGVKIGAGSLIGAGAVILPNIELGEKSVIGAGSVITSDVLPNTTVVGVPGKVLKKP
jgi:sugar O-acyltransferase (sialic acid O-acetyltransferase NeuD family)